MNACLLVVRNFFVQGTMSCANNDCLECYFFAFTKNVEKKFLAWNRRRYWSFVGLAPIGKWNVLYIIQAIFSQIVLNTKYSLPLQYHNNECLKSKSNERKITARNIFLHMFIIHAFTFQLQLLLCNFLVFFSWKIIIL